MKLIYKTIGELAYGLFSQDKTMTIYELEEYLKQKGLFHETDFELSESIGLAYEAFVAEGGQATANSIANAFTID